MLFIDTYYQNCTVRLALHKTETQEIIDRLPRIIDRLRTIVDRLRTIIDRLRKIIDQLRKIIDRFLLSLIKKHPFCLLLLVARRRRIRRLCRGCSNLWRYIARPTWPE